MRALQRMRRGRSSRRRPRDETAAYYCMASTSCGSCSLHYIHTYIHIVVTQDVLLAIDAAPGRVADSIGVRAVVQADLQIANLSIVARHTHTPGKIH